MEFYSGYFPDFLFRDIAKSENVFIASIFIVHEKVCMEFGYLDSSGAVSFESDLVDESTSRIAHRISEE